MYLASCSFIFNEPRVLIISFIERAAGVFAVTVTSTTISSTVFSSLRLGIDMVPSIPSEEPAIVPYLINNISNFLVYFHKYTSKNYLPFQC